MNLQSMIRAALRPIPEGWMLSGSILAYLVTQVLVTLGKMDPETARSIEAWLVAVAGVGFIRKNPTP